MVDMGIRMGSGVWAVPVTIMSDMVYVHTDIEQVTDVLDFNGEPFEDLWRYHEVQYTIEEYNKMSKAKKDKLKNGIAV